MAASWYGHQFDPVRAVDPAAPQEWTKKRSDGLDIVVVHGEAARGRRSEAPSGAVLGHDRAPGLLEVRQTRSTNASRPISFRGAPGG